MSEHTTLKRARNVLDVIRTGRSSLRKEVELKPQPEEEKDQDIQAQYTSFLPPSPYTLEENISRDPHYLRRCFVDKLEQMVDAYDSLDHQYSADYSGTKLQEDCIAIRQLARSFDIPK